jgi:hypothetical protein
MRLVQRFIARETIIHAADTYEIVEAYPEDKYFRAIYCLAERATMRFTYCSVLM